MTRADAVTDQALHSSLDARHAELFRICESALDAIGYEVVELEYGREGQGFVLRVYLDHRQDDEPVQRDKQPRRVNLDDCKQASRHLSAVLDVEDPITEPYRLEVSSPGVFRPLRKERDFRRFNGFEVRIKTVRPVEGRKSFKGTLDGVDDNAIGIRDSDGGDNAALWKIPLSSIRKAQLAEEY